VTEIDRILESEDVRAILRDYAAMHRPGLTSEEFLQYLRPHIRLGASLGRHLGERLGFRAATQDTFVVPQAPTKACVAILCGLVAHGIRVEVIERSSPGGSLMVTGIIPSSPVHFTGQITIEVSPQQEGSVVAVAVVYPGQLIAWGAGKRLVARVREKIEGALRRLGECPSLAGL